MDYSQAWMGPWGQALQASPLGGLMSPWAMGSQGAQGVVPQTGLQSLISGQADGNAEGTTPGTNMSGPQTPGERQAANEALGAARGYAANSLGNTALGAIGATAMGMSPSAGDIGKAAIGGLANPTGLAGLAGKVTANHMGFAGPQAGWAQKAISYGLNPVATGLLSAINPALGLAYGFMAPFGIDIAADGLNARKDEAYKDAMEDAHGSFGGRAASKEISGFADRHGFDGLGGIGRTQGYSPADLARGMSNKDATSVAQGRSPMGYSESYGGWGSVGGPMGGVESVNRGYGIGGINGGYGAIDAGYGPSMGGFAGLGIGNPSSYGGGNSSSGGSDRGGFGANDGDSDTAGNGGFGR